MRGSSQSRLDGIGYSPMDILWNARDVFIGNGRMIPELERHLTPVFMSVSASIAIRCCDGPLAGGLASDPQRLHEYASGLTAPRAGLRRGSATSRRTVVNMRVSASIA